MPHSARRRAFSLRSLRLDTATIWQASIAAGITFFLAWVTQAV